MRLTDNREIAYQNRSSTTAQQQDQPAGRGQASLAMLRRTWYRRLAMTNRLIADARLRIEIQKVQISQLTQKTKSTRKALARRRQFEVELQFLEDQRSVILERVRRFPLPADLLGGANAGARRQVLRHQDCDKTCGDQHPHVHLAVLAVEPPD